MHRTKVFVCLTALLLCVVLSAMALADGPLASLWNSGCDFLFRTDNVTVTGEATFSLDGVRFKTAQLNYIQDGYNSYYGLKLLTPKKDGSEQETGWTIIADEDGGFVAMEAFHPGAYRRGYDLRQNSLLRRSVQLDALTELGSLLVGQAEPLLPEGVVTLEEKDGGKTVRIAFTEGQLPDIAESALNVAANYLSDRWFSYGYERDVRTEEGPAFENYVTVTQALTDGTERWTLRQADMEFSLDGQGRLTGARGTLQAVSAFWDGEERVVDVQFDFAAADYGTSHVKPFDAEEYQVREVSWWGQEEYGEPEPDIDWDVWKAKAMELLQGQGYTVSDEMDWGGWYDESYISILIQKPDEDEYYCCYLEDGSLSSMYNEAMFSTETEEKELEEVNADTVEAAKAYIRSFLQEQNPAMAERLGELAPFYYMTAEDGSEYLSVSDEKTCVFVLRIAPSLRVEYFTEDYQEGAAE